MEIGAIKKSLIDACETGNLNTFKTAFFSNKVKIEAQSKENFFEFFQERIESAHHKVDGNLYLRINLPKEEDKFTEEYEFFSKNYLYSRLCVQLLETDESIAINVIPF